MSMYTHIEIENPEADAADIKQEWTERVEFFDPYISEGDSALTIEENSKYENDQVHGFALDYTSLYADAEVTIREEWTGEGGPNVDEATYRGGRRVDSKHDRLVPDNLTELIAAGRQAIRNSDTNATQEQQETLRAILDALDPNGAQA